MQSLTASLQVLTDEEKQLITAQQQEQQSLNWLTRLDELQQEASRRQQALQQALAEEEKAQPQLAALGLAQPARNLRPHWERIAEHSTALAHTRQQIEEVNTRLQSTMALRASIRHHAAKQSAELQQQQQSLNAGYRNTTASVSGTTNWRVGVHSSPNKPAIASICGNGSNS